AALVGGDRALGSHDVDPRRDRRRRVDGSGWSAVNAAALIDELERRNTAAVELALVVSLAVRVDPDLLRHARLMVGADAAAEADLWWSDLVAAQNADGFMLVPDVAEELRARLAQPQRRK